MASQEVAVLERLDTLIQRAGTVGDDWASYVALRTRVSTAAAAIAGPDSDYYRFFNEMSPTRASMGASMMVATLHALRADVEGGYLRRQADVVAAEVFGDFLDMAGHLLESGYIHPAASLIGAVLEDGLRRMAANSEVKLRAGDDIGVLNNRLAAKQVYSNLQRKQVDVWAAVRNHADHGEFDKVGDGDVREMYAGVTRFLAERLG